MSELEGGAPAPELAAPAPEVAIEAPAGPIDYAFNLPEGLELPDESIANIKAKFGELGIPADRAQAAFDMYVGTSGDHAKAGQDAWLSTQKEWRAEIMADPRLGGAKYQQSVQDLRSGMETLIGKTQTNEVIDAFRITGSDSNPAIFRMLHAALAIHAPPRGVTGYAPSPKETRSAGGTLYPTQGALGRASDA